MGATSQNAVLKEYLYYYYSSKYEVAVAKMKFKLNLLGKDWVDGILEYLDTSYNTKWTFVMERIWPIKGPSDNAKAAFYLAKCPDPPVDEQINFFTINIKNRKLEDRKVLFLTYSVLESENKIPSSGIGLLIEEENISDKLNKVAKDGIDSWIVNALRSKKHTLEGWISRVYNREDEVKGNLEKDIESADEQFHHINKLKGFYRGYYLRNDIGELPDEIKDPGGVAFVILEIKGSGDVYLYYNLSDDNTIKKYKGFITFPSEEGKKFLKISLSLEKTHRFYMFLAQTIHDGHEYIGTFSGWKKMFDPFSTAILIKKIRKNELPPNSKNIDIHELRKHLKISFLGRIHKSRLDPAKYDEEDNKKEISEIIKIFKDNSQYLKAYTGCLELIEKCLPKSFIEEE